MPRTSLYASIVVVMAVAATVVAIVQGNWWGLVFLPLAGVFSNIAWLNVRREQLARAAAADRD